MTYDPELKELTRLGKRLDRQRKEMDALMEEIKAEVLAAMAAKVSHEKIAGKLGLSRLTVAKMKDRAAKPEA